MVSIKLFVLCLGFFAVNIKKSQAVTEEERKVILSVLAPMFVECSAEYDVNEDLIKGLTNSGDFKDVNPCFLACFLKKAKVLDDDGKYNVPYSHELIEKYVSGEDDKKNISDAVNECSPINDKDVSDDDKGCDRATLLFECMLPHKDLFL